jgi:hypothetical protein
MPEQVFVIAPGNTPIYEVVKSEDGLSLTIRSAANHDYAISMPSSAVDVLISALNEFKNSPQPGPDTN